MEVFKHGELFRVCPSVSVSTVSVSAVSVSGVSPILICLGSHPSELIQYRYLYNLSQKKFALRSKNKLAGWVEMFPRAPLPAQGIAGTSACQGVLVCGAVCCRAGRSADFASKALPETLRTPQLSSAQKELSCPWPREKLKSSASLTQRCGHVFKRLWCGCDMEVKMLSPPF
jgi:hypothetical protein